MGDLWWHAHGAVLSSGEFALMVIHETKKCPEDAPLWISGPDGTPLARLRSWDREPSDNEKEDLYPPGWEMD